MAYQFLFFIEESTVPDTNKIYANFMKTEKQKLVENCIKNLDAAAVQLQAMGYENISTETIWAILQGKLSDQEIYTDIFFKEISAAEMLTTVLESIEKNGIILGAFDFVFDFSFKSFPDDELEKARIRQNGEIWVIHKNDADPFPSNPHAHNYRNNRNLKLHLGTGEFYEKHRVVEKMPLKKLEALREKIKKEFPSIKLPPKV